MLFDLKGKRRRVVQGVYLTLAILMGGGLVLFGIGGGTNGGLLDAFKGGGGGSNAEKTLNKEIEAAQKRVALNPSDQGALILIATDNYRLAAEKADPNTGVFTDDGKKKLSQAASAWERYLALAPTKPNDTLASYMLQAYSPTGLNKPDKAKQAAEIFSEAHPSANAYINVVLYASLAGDTRTAKLAGQKALQLAPKSQRSSVKALIKQAEAAGTTSASSGATGTTGAGG
jgi:tetratricopeptide (TPR) repeat protein